MHIENQIHNFASWKAAFDRDLAGWQPSGVRRYQILRPVDDAAYVIIDLDFDSTFEAASFFASMGEVRQSPQGAQALVDSPQARIDEVFECKEY